MKTYIPRPRKVEPKWKKGFRTRTCLSWPLYGNWMRKVTKGSDLVIVQQIAMVIGNY